MASCSTYASDDDDHHRPDPYTDDCQPAYAQSFITSAEADVALEMFMFAHCTADVITWMSASRLCLHYQDSGYEAGSRAPLHQVDRIFIARQHTDARY